MMGKETSREGPVYQRKDGRWVAHFYLETGKKKCLYRKREKDASVALRKAFHEHGHPGKAKSDGRRGRRRGP
jgi:hypothetical protein